MYSIFFHLLWLSLLEIIFYFEYIGPLETKSYKNVIKKFFQNYNSDYYNYDNLLIYLNISNLDNNQNDIYNNYIIARNKRKDSNYKLFINIYLRI